MPSSSEADPTPLLAIVVPLMFGYMFGDVGQGLVHRGRGLVVSQALCDRAPADGRRPVGGRCSGCCSAACSACTALIPALWLHPLDAPLAVLLAPLVGGAVLLTAGAGPGCARSVVARRDAPLAAHRRGADRRLPRRCSRRSSRRPACWWPPPARCTSASGTRCITRRLAAGLERDRRAGREDAADPDQHAVVRPRRRVRARPRRPVVGDRRADGRGRQHRRQGAGAGARQRAS